MAKQKKEWETQALKCYWEAERNGPTLSAILCPKHKRGLFARRPNARGCGEFFPIEDCELCEADPRLTREIPAPRKSNYPSGIVGYVNDSRGNRRPLMRDRRGRVVVHQWHGIVN